MKDEFKIITLVRLWFLWRFGCRKLAILFLEEVAIKNRNWTNFRQFLHFSKQRLIEKKFGREHMLNMTIYEMKNTKI